MQIPVEPIAPGYDARLEIAYPNAFADAAQLTQGALVAQFRASIDADDVLFEARTADGTITVARGSDETLVIVTIPSEDTSNMAPDTWVSFDFVRLDGGVKDVVPGQWRWPVRKAITRNVA
jgi:hypothetical protein